MDIKRNLKSPKRSLALHISPWLIVGLALLLGTVVAVSALRNAQRERNIMTRNLMERAQALILAVEAGARAGMGLHMGEPYLQALVEETAKQPGIVSMAVTDGQGRIRAHNNHELIGQPFQTPEGIEGLKPGDEPRWRIRTVAGGDSVFEVYKCFSPLVSTHRHMMRMPGMETGQPTSNGLAGSLQEEWPVIAVGLDVRPFEEAMEQDLRHSVMMALLLGLVILGGAVSIFWLQHSRLSRRLLQDSQTFATEVVTCLPVGLLTTDHQGRVSLVNAAAANILGKEQDQLAGSLLGHADDPAWEGIIRDMADGTMILEQEVNIPLPGDKMQPVSVSASRIVNDEGSFLGNLFILRSLGEVRDLQERLRRSERLSALGNLAAGVAHEIRNPLSSIRGFASYLAKKLQDGPDQEAARVMVQEVDRLNRVVSELLEFARPGEVMLVESDLNAVMSHALRLGASDALSKSIRIIFSPDKTLPRIRLDPERMTQAFLNIILNAIQAMDDGGVLTIEAKPAETGVAIAITDTGHGMSSEVMVNIFNPYFTTKPSGTGLGLAITHRIVENHHGAISVDSQPGSYTTFTVFLPSMNHSDLGGK